MLTYEYKCSKCRRVFEVRQRISDPPLETCEACGGKVRRLLSPAPFILKGGGWYVTDYPSEARKKAVESEKSATGAGEKKADASATTTASSTASAPPPASPSSGSTSSDSTSSDTKKKSESDAKKKSG